MNPQQHRPRKRFGQNFLEDFSVIARIAAAIRPKKEDHLVEIGPGQGALTKALVSHVGRFDAIELDKDLIPRLQEQFVTNTNFHLHHADVLKFDWSQLPQTKLWRVVGNLPYNISSPLLIKLFSMSQWIEDIHVMLQNEVALRLAARPGGKQYGRLSVIAQYHCRVEKLFEISPTAFYPQPKVISAMVVLRPRRALTEPCKDIKALEFITRHAFGQRRKTLSNTLKSVVSDIDWDALGITPSKRPEQITVDEYVRLANFYQKNKKEN